MLIERLERVALLGSAWVLYLLLALSVVSVSMMVERWFFFWKRRGDTDSLGDALLAKLRDGDRRGAEQVLSASATLEAQIVRPAMGWLDGGPDAVSEVIDAELGKTRRELDKGSTFLGTLGNNAPFIGLLGTVLGVIQAFHQLGDANGGQNKGAMNNVMVGISEALIATGVGLVVALPAVIAYNVVARKVADVEGSVGILAKQLLAWLKSEEKLAGELRALGELPPKSATPEPSASRTQEATAPKANTIGRAAVEQLS